MKDAQSKVNIVSINNYLMLAPLLRGGAGGGLQSTLYLLDFLYDFMTPDQ